MKAKDTVIKLPIDLNGTTTPLLERQAEISFKVGYKYALEGAVMEGAYESIKKLGIKEVVDYLDFKESPEWEACAVTIPWKDWQAKLKEWGIE